MGGASIVGTGLAPEGIGTNDVMYELMNEMGWRLQPVDPQTWVQDYVQRRYGTTNIFTQKAWNLLIRSVYSAESYGPHPECHAVMVRRPSLNQKIFTWYNPEDVFKAWDAMLATADELQTVATFR